MNAILGNGEQALSPVLWSGFLIGVRHALDADHLAAVSTLVSQRSNLKRAMWVGTAWGVGHTATLLLAGVLVLAFRRDIAAPLTVFFDLLVAAMLIALGLIAITNYRRQPDLGSGGRPPWLRPHRPLMVGMVHGLAGSSSLVLLVLTTMPSVGLGLWYILLFGAGSIVGMMVVSVAIAAPILLSARVRDGLDTTINALTGGVSVFIGLMILYRIVF